MSKDLTEKWKKGELDDGCYYVKIKGDEDYMLSWEDNHWYEFGWDCWFFDSHIVEILAEIPSYEKYKCLETGIILANAVIKNTEEENQKLKELLKECRDELNKYDDYTEFNEVGRYKLLTKIEEKLNDKERG